MNTYEGVEIQLQLFTISIIDVRSDQLRSFPVLFLKKTPAVTIEHGIG
jgi:hypothetical protein